MDSLSRTHNGRRLAQSLFSLSRESVVVMALSPQGLALGYEISRAFRCPLSFFPVIPLLVDGEIQGAELPTRCVMSPSATSDDEGEPLYHLPFLKPRKPPVLSEETTVILVDDLWWLGAWGLYALLEERVTMRVRRLIVAGRAAPESAVHGLIPPAHSTLFLELLPQETSLTPLLLPQKDDTETLQTAWIERQFSNLTRVRSRAEHPKPKE